MTDLAAKKWSLGHEFLYHLAMDLIDFTSIINRFLIL